jgi:hypothetical protein
MPDKYRTRIGIICANPLASIKVSRMILTRERVMEANGSEYGSTLAVR